MINVWLQQKVTPDQLNYLCPICNNYLTVGYNEFCENCINGYIEHKHKLFFYGQTKIRIMKSLIDTKKLIFDAIYEKLESENVEKILLVLGLHSDKYSVHIKPIDATRAMILKLEPSETSMIKRLFVTKMKYKIKEVEKYKNIIVSITKDNKDFEIFLNDYNDEVTKFEI